MKMFLADFNVMNSIIT